MRFTPVVVAGLVAVAKAQDTTSAADSAPTSGLSSEVQDCIDSCAGDDVNCIAHCTPVPSPDEGNLEALNDCVGDCDQGSGSEEDTVAYGNCVNQCVVENYYDPEIGTPGQGQSGSGSGGDSSDDGDSDSSSGDSKDGDSKDGDSKDGDSKDGEGSDDEGSDGEGSDGEGSDGEEGGDDEGAAAGLVASPLLALFGVAAAVLAF